jgi:hypothetical protein
MSPNMEWLILTNILVLVTGIDLAKSSVVNKSFTLKSEKLMQLWNL